MLRDSSSWHITQGLGRARIKPGLPTYTTCEVLTPWAPQIFLFRQMLAILTRLSILQELYAESHKEFIFWLGRYLRSQEAAIPEDSPFQISARHFIRICIVPLCSLWRVTSFSCFRIYPYASISYQALLTRRASPSYWHHSLWKYSQIWVGSTKYPQVRHRRGLW